MLNFGGWGAYAAHVKCRPWYEGFAAGAMLGPIGPILIACLPVGDVGGVTPEALQAFETKARKRYTDVEWAKRSLKDGAKPN